MVDIAWGWIVLLVVVVGLGAGLVWVANSLRPEGKP